MLNMKRITDFENKKIKCDEINLFCIGFECYDKVQTYNNYVDTKKLRYSVGSFSVY